MKGPIKHNKNIILQSILKYLYIFFWSREYDERIKFFFRRHGWRSIFNTGFILQRSAWMKPKRFDAEISRKFTETIYCSTPEENQSIMSEISYLHFDRLLFLLLYRFFIICSSPHTKQFIQLLIYYILETTKISKETRSTNSHISNFVMHGIFEMVTVNLFTRRQLQDKIKVTHNATKLIFF